MTKREQQLSYTYTMFRIGFRRFATTARRAAETAAHMEGSNTYGIGVSKAQGIVKGLTGGGQSHLYYKDYANRS